MDEVLFGVLAEHVGGYLESVEHVAASGRAASAEEVRRLAAAWQALLDLHRPTGRFGACAGCVVQRRRAMCTVWRVANAFFVQGRPR